MFEVLKGFGKSCLILLGLVWVLGSFAQDVRTTELKVISKQTKQPIAGATVKILPAGQSYVCNQEGVAFIKLTVGTSEAKVIVSAIGYSEGSIFLPATENKVQVELEQSIGNLNEIVLSASRKAEQLLSSPVSIEKYGLKAIRETPGIDFYDGLKNLKGIDMVNSGLNYKQINSRGFAGTMNTRFLVLIDGMDMQAPGLGWNLGNQYGTTELDIEHAELIPGAASALYGPTAFNGMLSMHTKDPFTHTGLSWSIKTGLNHINDQETGAHGYNDLALRWAKKYNDRFAVKWNLAYSNGLDWYANDQTDINVKTPLAQRGAKNPARDALNTYGDEIQKTIPGIGLISRTGYEEKYLADYNVYGLKGNVQLQYKIKEHLVLSYFQSYGKGNMNYTGSSRYTTKNYEFNSAKLELKGNDFFIRSYRIWENSNQYYNSRNLAQFINRSWVRDLNGNPATVDQADQVWFNRYEQAYKGQIVGVNGSDHLLARQFADRGRYIPGSFEFNNVKEYFKNSYVPFGARVNTECSFIHTEGQYDLNKLKNIADISTGGSLRIYNVLSNGSLFRTSAKGITYKEIGVFIQAQKSVLNNKLKINSSVRYDKNQNFHGSITPRVGLVLQTNPTGFFRASFQTGFRNPTSVDQYVFLRSGLVTLIGGAPNNSKGMTVYQNSYTAASVSQFSNAFNVAVSNGQTYSQALAANTGLLKKASVRYIQPERQHAFEIGYKTELNHKLYLDVNTYYNSYSNFIVNTNVVNTTNPVIDNSGNPTTAAGDEILMGKSTTYQLYTNSDATVSSYGFSIGLNYKLPLGYEFSGNVTHAKLNAKSISASMIAPFNTPNYATNAVISNANVSHHVGFSLSWHWQNSFEWYGTFTGNNPGGIHAYSLMDLQINKKIQDKNMMIKIGGNNILNHRVAQTYGSPSIGAIYYISFVHGIN